MKIEILDETEADLIEGFYFYERQEAGLGWYFSMPRIEIDGVGGAVQRSTLLANVCC